MQLSVKQGGMAFLLIIVLLLGGCASVGENFVYQQEADEIPEGPGLFSGENEGYIITINPKLPPKNTTR